MKVYKMFDADGSGNISFAQLKRVAKELGESMTDEEIAAMLEHGNKSGKPGKGVSFDDFYRLMQKKVRTWPVNRHTCAVPRSTLPCAPASPADGCPPPSALSQHNAGALDDLLGDDE